MHNSLSDPVKVFLCISVCICVFVCLCMHISMKGRTRKGGGVNIDSYTDFPFKLSCGVQALVASSRQFG